MAIIVDEGERKEILLPPEGTFTAVCYQVWDLGFQTVEYMGSKKIVGQLIIGWEIDELIPSGEYAGKRFVVTKKYTKSLYSGNGKMSNLCKDLTAWRGRAFTDEEKKGFDVERLIGANCLLSIVHNTSKKENVYANVSAIMRLHKGTASIKPENGLTTPKWITKLQGAAVSPEINGHLKEPETETTDDEDIPF